jgi:hypothetical protein
MAISTRQIKRALKEVLAEGHEDWIQPTVVPPSAEQQTQNNSAILTQDVVDDLLRYKRYKGVKEGTIKTYAKTDNQFARDFLYLPSDTDTLREYLDRFKSNTGRYKRNQYDRLKMLYEHACCHFGLEENPFDYLERPIVTLKQIRTLSLREACMVDSVVDTMRERCGN